MNFNEELQKLSKVKKQCLSEELDMGNQMLAELAEAERQITEKYAKLKTAKYQELDEHNSRIDVYCKLIASYSIFNIRKIGNVIASLIRTFEGINYIYKRAEYNTTEVEVLEFDKSETKVKKYPIMIVAEEESRAWYSDKLGKKPNTIVKDGKAIILVDDSVDSEMDIQFYRPDDNTHTLAQCVRFGRFSYVKDFIDEVISYRIEHNLKYITPDELQRLKIEFISSRVEQIEENYKLVDEQMRKKLDADKENRQLKLQRILNKSDKSN